MTNQINKVVRLASEPIADLRELGYGSTHAAQLPGSFDALAQALDDLRDKESEKPSNSNESDQQERDRSEQEAAAAEAFYKVARKRPAAQPGPDSPARASSQREFAQF